MARRPTVAINMNGNRYLIEREEYDEKQHKLWMVEDDPEKTEEEKMPQKEETAPAKEKEDDSKGKGRIKRKSA